MSPKQEEQPYKKRKKGHQLIFGIGASAVSGVLVALSMPNFDIGILAWVALVPLLIAIMLLPEKSSFLLAMPFGLIWSISAHNWYLSMFSTAAAYGLIFGVASWYAGLIVMGFMLLLIMTSFPMF